MEIIVYSIIGVIALLGSGLTLFSGFGLGTILLPVFAFFFPVDVSIALTAVVHFLNNLFKLALLGKHVDKVVILKFGLPSIISAFVGAYLLAFIDGIEPLFEYTVLEKTFIVTPVKLVISVLLLFFAMIELVPALARIKFDRKYLSLGGLLSGFFGGLSGNQGALRSAFLMRANLSKDSFIATGVAIACLIDISRLSVYSTNISKAHNQLDYTLVIVAILSAFAGAYFGNKLLKKVTVKGVQYVVATMLILFSLLLGLGII